jgi:hypothetical protein
LLPRQVLSRRLTAVERTARTPDVAPAFRAVKENEVTRFLVGQVGNLRTGCQPVQPGASPALCRRA